MNNNNNDLKFALHEKLLGWPRYYTATNAQVATSLLTSRYQDAFAWLATACSTTSLLQVVNRLDASCQQVMQGLQQVATSLQMTSCNMPDFNKLFAT